jgi:hypothetical protein
MLRCIYLPRLFKRVRCKPQARIFLAQIFYSPDSCQAQMFVKPGIASLPGKTAGLRSAGRTRRPPPRGLCRYILRLFCGFLFCTDTCLHRSP